MNKLTKTVLKAVVLLLIGYGVISFASSWKKTKTVVEVYTNPEGMLVDVDGDGIKEEMRLKLNDEETYVVASEIIDIDGNTVASTPEWLTFPSPMTESFKTYNLFTSDDKEFYSLDFTAGTHQTERMIFEVVEGQIMPVCFKKELSSPKDCLFYSANSDEGVVIVDLDNDGYAELVEYVDEYPADGTLSEEEENAITESFGEVDEGAKRIAMREKGGRGRTVVWAIYSYDGVYFEPQTDDSYEKYFSLLKKDNPDLMRKSDLSKESLEYNEFVKEFWD